MGSSSGIEWTDATWNPTVGCSRVSEGCRHCYAEVMAARIANAAQARLRKGEDLTPTQAAYRRVVRWKRGGKAAFDLYDKALPLWNGRVELIPEKLAEPLRWTKPRRIFVNSMSDLFHEGVPFETIAAVLGVIAAARQHTFQILTKRPEVAVKFFAWIRTQRPGLASALVQQGAAWPSKERAVEPVLCMYLASEKYGVPLPEDCCAPGIRWPLQNLELGTSVEDQKTANERIPHILRCPAAFRIVSYEPALGPVDFHRIADPDLPGFTFDTLSLKGGIGKGFVDPGKCVGEIRRIDWIIAGGESGHGARPPKAEWFRSVRDQCAAANVPFFFKQWGKYAPYDQLPEQARMEMDMSGHRLYTDPGPPDEIFGGAKTFTGRELDGVTHDDFPEVQPCSR